MESGFGACAREDRLQTRGTPATQHFQRWAACRLAAVRTYSPIRLTRPRIVPSHRPEGFPVRLVDPLDLPGAALDQRRTLKTPKFAAHESIPLPWRRFMSRKLGRENAVE